MKKIIRVYELGEALHNKDMGYNSSDLEYIDLSQPQFVLKEYLQVNENKAPTGRTFQINKFIEIIKQAKPSGTMIEKLSDHEDSVGYHFSLPKNGNLKSDNFSNLETKEIEVIIPLAIAEKILFNEQVKLLEESLSSIAKVANIITRSEEKIKNYKLEKRNKYIKAACVVAITGAVAFAGIPKFYHYLQKQQEIQRQEEIEQLKQQGLTISELQQINAYHTLEQWDLYLEEQRKEHEKSRKLP